jgi:hypothetical protein
VYRQAFILAFALLLMGGWRFITAAPQRFPQFAERSITPPGSYDNPQWSPDSRYLAFVSGTLDAALVVYDTLTERSWTVATGIDGSHYRWTPDGSLSYLKYRPDLSGTPYPDISDLHRVSRDGQNDEVIATGLSSVGDFDWFSDGERAVITLTDPTERTYYNDLYLLNARTGAVEPLLEAAVLDFDYFVMHALTPDEQSLLLYGIQEGDGQTEARIVLYNLNTRTITTQFLPREIIPTGNIAYPPPTTGGGGWVGGQRWFLTSIVTPGGECYNYALFFFDVQNLENSFCIPTSIGIVSAPAIAPDLSRISYLTVSGPGSTYVMISPLPADLRARLEPVPATAATHP